MSNIRWVMMNPPAMLTEEMSVATAAKACAVECGIRPPPITQRPPAAVRPEMALVTLMSGEWSAGATPHTV